MPLVEREIVTDSADEYYHRRKRRHQLYVAPHAVKPGDRTVPVSEIPPRQLRDLQTLYPAEYPATATPAPASVRDSAHAYEALNAKAAIDLVRQTDDPGEIAMLYALELQRAEPRGTVLAVFASRGFGAAPAEADGS